MTALMTYRKNGFFWKPYGCPKNSLYEGNVVRAMLVAAAVLSERVVISGYD
jgi:hypothetical protein